MKHSRAAAIKAWRLLLEHDLAILGLITVDLAIADLVIFWIFKTWLLGIGGILCIVALVALVMHMDIPAWKKKWEELRDKMEFLETLRDDE